MANGETVDKLIRSALQAAAVAEEPSPAVREALLAAAASENSLRSALGPNVPPLIEELQEESERVVEWSTQVITTIPLARRQLLLLAAPLYAVR
jgi:hypothetical protein